MTSPPKPPPRTPAWATPEPGAIVFIDPPETGYTTEEIYTLFGPGPQIDDEGNIVPDESLTAAAEVHTGAMIALVPSEADAARFALGGGEPLDQLHLTLLYLGEAADIDDESRELLLTNVETFVSGINEPVKGNAFSVAAFNPTGEEPCIVILIGNGESIPLDDVHEAAIWAAEESGVDTSLSKRPWIPHVTLAYVEPPIVGFDVDGVAEQRMGEVTFDRLRVALGGEVHDFNLGPIIASAFHMPGKHNQKDHNRGGKKDTTGDDGDASPKKSGGGGGGGGTPAEGDEAHAACPLSIDRKDELTQDEYLALRTYQGEGYMDIQDGLRHPPPNPFVEPEIRHMDDAMRRSPLQDDIRVHRGVDSGRRTFGDAWDSDMTGGEFTERGFMSTTTNETIARQQFSSPVSARGAHVVLSVPAGTSAIDLGHGVSEAEILLDRGLSWRIISDTGPGTGRVIEMELIT